MANPGKNKLVRYARIYVDGYDLSGDARSVEILENSYGEADLTVWNNTIKKYLPDYQRIIGVRGLQCLLNDETAGSFTRLKSAEGIMQHELSFVFGGNAEPSVGDPAYVLAAAQMVDNTPLDGRVFAIRADFLPETTYGGDNPWGKILHPKTNIAVTTTGSTVDFGTPGTLRWQANLHILASSGGTWVITIEHSTDAVGWSNLTTFAANGAAITSEHRSAEAVANRYVRAVFTRTSGSITPVVTFARI